MNFLKKCFFFSFLSSRVILSELGIELIIEKKDLDVDIYRNV